MANDTDKIAASSENNKQDKTQEDERRAARERYLSLWLSVSKHQPVADFRLYGGTNVKGHLVGTDSESNRFRVDNLETPMGALKQGVLRSTDIEQIRFFLSPSNKILDSRW